MTIERHTGATGGTSLMDVLDRVLDKGIVVDAWVRVSLVGIDLVTVEARIVVASIDTYLRYAEAIGVSAPTGRPFLAERDRYEAFGAPSATPAERVDGVEQAQPKESGRQTRRR